MDDAVLPGIGVLLLTPNVVQLLNAGLRGVPIKSDAFHVYDVTSTKWDASYWNRCHKSAAMILDLPAPAHDRRVVQLSCMPHVKQVLALPTCIAENRHSELWDVRFFPDVLVHGFHDEPKCKFLLGGQLVELTSGGH